jgi:hypothetical protein
MISKYLDVLIRLHIIHEEVPVTASPSFQRRLYLISYYITTYLRFAYLNRTEIEAQRGDKVLAHTQKAFLKYCGSMIEVLITDQGP